VTPDEVATAYVALGEIQTAAIRVAGRSGPADREVRGVNSYVGPGDGTSVRRIGDVLALATRAEVSEGTAWYSAARTFCSGLRRYGVTLDQAAGVVAVLSPLLSWPQNMVYAERVVSGRSMVGAGVLAANLAKAGRIMAGEDVWSVVRPPAGRPRSGQKVRAFLACILTGGDTPVVCLDRHAYALATGRTDVRALDRSGVYERLAAAYRDAGYLAGLRGSEVQAVTWLTWRRLSGRTDQYERAAARESVAGFFAPT